MIRPPPCNTSGHGHHGRRLEPGCGTRPTGGMLLFLRRIHSRVCRWPWRGRPRCPPSSTRAREWWRRDRVEVSCNPWPIKGISSKYRDRLSCPCRRAGWTHTTQAHTRTKAHKGTQRHTKAQKHRTRRCPSRLPVAIPKRQGPARCKELGAGEAPPHGSARQITPL